MASFDDLWRETMVNINGEFVRGPDATVSVLDWSFVYGDGVFEGIAIAQGKLLKVDYHLERLYRSVTRVGIDLPLGPEEMRDRWIETARRNDMTDGYMRPLVTRGEGPLGIHSYDALSEPNVVIIPQRHRTGSLHEVQARRARLSGYRSPSPVGRDPRVKANQYLPNILAVRALAGTDADIPVFVNDGGYVTEAGAANVFVVQDGVVRTPPEHEILSGTTRRVVLELAEAGAIPVVRVDQVTPYDLFTADECFVTGSLNGATAITHLDGDRIGSGSVGERTVQINEVLAAHLIETGIPIE